MAKQQPLHFTGNHMGVLDAIHQRRAVRSYGPQPVERGAIQTLLDAAVRAPTAMHEEPWAFVIIQDPATLRRLSDFTRREMKEAEHRLHAPKGHPTHLSLPQNIFYDAGTLIVICGRAEGPFVVADCWLAAENLMLAAYALGLGTCVIGLAVPALNSLQWKAELGIPHDVTAYAPIIVGVPASDSPPSPRNAPQVLAWK